MERLLQMEHACNHKDLEMSSPNTFCIIPKFYGLRWKLGRKSYEESLPEQDSDLWERPGLKSPYDNAYDHTRSYKKIAAVVTQSLNHVLMNCIKISLLYVFPTPFN
ncbi:hypothetical protein T06_4050 [Trichinella sp. T6]|nr:hypothetical protein T06_4050 [Trichinella sp. T6]